MHHQIGIVTNGGGKVSVDGCGQAVMMKFLYCYGTGGKVEGLHHTSSGHYPKHGVEVRLILQSSFIEGGG